jgi:alkaline phosphatase D
MSRGLTRRSFLAGGLALAGPARRAFVAAPVGQSARFSTSLFTLGVASGDPAPDGVVLWTRLATDLASGGGMPPTPVDVYWEVARDEAFSAVVRSGRATALPEWAHSVHVELAGLEPDRWYWYRFRAADQHSPVGRTRTLPPPGAPSNRLRFAFASCQQYEMGYFTAYRHMSAEDLSVVFHLGDYIYEAAATPGRVRQHLGAELMTLEDYRNRYAQYRTDPDLQAAHAAFPFIVTWDDHEVDNNYAGMFQERGDPVDLFERRRAAAYRAYYEHMPLRTRSLADGPRLQLYRRFAYGSLASFFVLDTRQFRTDQPCGDGIQVPCRGAFDEKATMLGPEQERWLGDGFLSSKSRWNVLPQQVMIAPVDRAAGPEVRSSMDQWSGYDSARRRLLQLLARKRLGNPVVLTGDVHSNYVNDLQLDFRDPKSPVVATELVGTSITSGGDGVDESKDLSTLLAENPFVKFHNEQRGYVVCEITAKTMQADYRVLDYVSRQASPVRTRASFVVEDGRPGAQALKR